MTDHDRIAKWNDRYARCKHAIAVPEDLVLRVAREFSPGAALDLACGLGRNALALARAGWTVTAVDASSSALGRLRQGADAENLRIETVAADLESNGFEIDDERYDLVCDCLYLQRSLLARIKKGTRVGGLAAMVLPMVDDAPGVEPMNPDFLVKPGELLSWFDDWELLEYKENREADGRRMTARLLARKPPGSERT